MVLFPSKMVLPPSKMVLPPSWTVLPQAMAWVQYWFRVLSLKFCGKSKKNCGDISQLSPAFCMCAISVLPLFQLALVLQNNIIIKAVHPLQQNYKHSLNTYLGQMVFITGDQLAPLGSCMDNTWVSLGTTWRPSGIIWKHLSAKCFETTKKKLTTWRQLWDNYETNFGTSMRHLWLKAKALRQLWDNFGTTLGQLWHIFETALRELFPSLG